MDTSQGLISNIERFAMHDGPGIRTLIFMKGCPLRCRWCSSPQTWNPRPEVLYNDQKCLKCGTCIKTCPSAALSLREESGITIDRARCDGCGECSRSCPNQALELVGRYLGLEELFQEVLKDSGFYRRSGGGVTVGGGEATLQAEFVTRFLELCHRRSIHTSIETCGYTRWERMKQILKHLDLVHIDIKHMNETRHLELTGVSNRIILDNAVGISKSKPLIIRVPVIPGCNDDDKNIKETAQFAAGLGAKLVRMELLPYHKLGSQTYRRLGLTYGMEEIESPNRDHMERLQDMVKAFGVPVNIGS